MANDFNPFIPQWWAMGALAILNEALVAVPLFNTDFSEMFATGGQVVNTRRPNRMTATRKALKGNIVAQDVSAENVAVTLDQHIYNSFTVHDIDKQFSMEDLIQTYLKPAGFALAKQADSIVLGHLGSQLLASGYVAGNPAQKVYDSVVDGNLLMTNNLAPDEGRHVITNPNTVARMQKDDLLRQMYSSGTDRVLRAGEIGNLVGTDFFRTQNLSQRVITAGTPGTNNLTLAAAAKVGDTTVQTTSNVGTQASAYAILAGEWVSIAGVPYKVTAVAGSGNPYTLTLNRAITYPAGSGEVIFSPKSIGFATAYATGWSDPISYRSSGDYSYAPAKGDFIEISGKLYAVVDVGPNAGDLLLDRPLENPIVTSTVAQKGPAAGNVGYAVVPSGNYNLMAQRDAMTVVLRTLQPTPAGAGVMSYTATYNNLGVRAQMGYNLTTQTMQVTLDFLMGVKMLDARLGTLVVC